MSELGPRLREHFEAQGPPIDVDALVERDQVRADEGRRRGLRLAAAVALVAAAVGVGLLVVGLLVEHDLRVPIIAPGPDETPEQAPSKDFEESGSWTVETSLGPWTWTWIPEDEGAQSLWAEAERVRPSGEEDVRQRVNRMEVPVPSVAGMGWVVQPWDPWHPRVRWARSDVATIALAKVDGWVDWELVTALVDQHYDIDACPVWLDQSTAIALVERDESDCFWADPSDAFAALTADLVAGDPGAVEYRDEQTGELVLRLDAADPAVTAEQLVVGRLWHLLVDAGAGFGLVEPPWNGLPVIEADVAVGPEGLVAVAVGPADWPIDGSMMLRRWGSSDGVAWQELGDPVVLPLDDGIADLQLVGEGSRLVVLAIDGREQTLLWTWIDGVDWQQVGPVSEGGRDSLGTTLASTSFGWVLTGQPQLPEMTCEVWVSPDGVAWEQVAFQPDVETRRDADLACSIAVDDAVYLRMEWWPPPADEPAPPPGFASEPTQPDTERPSPPGCAPIEPREGDDGDVWMEGGGCGLWIGRLTER
jgi:hypothetical protein